ncbi:hypothetical protein M0802_007143 [Mischocyttarus mexicanus]|nr:hypothetical protein M0802_007143 [Mischocyttarus mexicanus]
MSGSPRSYPARSPGVASTPTVTRSTVLSLDLLGVPGIETRVRTNTLYYQHFKSFKGPEFNPTILVVCVVRVTREQRTSRLWIYGIDDDAQRDLA